MSTSIHLENEMNVSTEVVSAHEVINNDEPATDDSTTTSCMTNSSADHNVIGDVADLVAGNSSSDMLESEHAGEFDKDVGNVTKEPAKSVNDSPDNEIVTASNVDAMVLEENNHESNTIYDQSRESDCILENNSSANVVIENDHTTNIKTDDNLKNDIMFETSHKSNTEIENTRDTNVSTDDGHELNAETDLKTPKTPDNHLPVFSNAEKILTPSQLNLEAKPGELPTEQPSLNDLLSSAPPPSSPSSPSPPSPPPPPTTTETADVDDSEQGAAAGVAPDESVEGKESIYNVKWIRFNQVSLPIVTQNENGPCPLLAIMNYLFLQQRVQLETRSNLISSSQLISLLADYIFEHVPNRILNHPSTRLNYEQKMHDAIAMFPNLQTGLDVNVRFTGVSHFEYTPSSEIFDLLDIPLYHGWLVDPELNEVVKAVSNATYNQLVEMVINQKSSNQLDLVEKALIAEEFLNATASQLTYHGLCELGSKLHDSQMGVLFRNNHFHTLLKHDVRGALYVLATDQGFLNEPRVVWETLTNIEGDSHFCDANFRIFQSSSGTKNSDQIDQDYFVALSMEQEQEESSQSASNWTDLSNWTNLGLTDEELAMRLQEEENSLASPPDTTAGNRQQHSVGATGSSKNQGTTRNTSKVTTGAKAKKDSLCAIM